MANTEITVGSLCAGVGMFDLGIRAGLEYLGRKSRTVFYCEREAYAANQLVTLMESECLDAAPVWSDLTTFDGKPFYGLVDIIIAGLPCQPYSVAGKQQGNQDSRSFGDGDGPIPHALRIIDEVRPALVYFENVPAWVAARQQWFKPVGERLCDMGYALQDVFFVTASSVGASHKRERAFILAIHQSRGFGILRQSSGGGGFADRGCEELDHTPSPRHNGTGIRPAANSSGGECMSGAGCEGVGESDSARWTPTGTGPEINAGHEYEPGCGQLADTLRTGRQQIAGSAYGDETAHEGRSSQHDHIAASAGAGMADTSSTRPQGSEQRGTRNPDRGGGASTWIS